MIAQPTNQKRVVAPTQRRVRRQARAPRSGLLLGKGLAGVRIKYGHSGQIGTIEGVLFDTIHGRVACALLRFDDFAELGGRFFPAPWSSLVYDVSDDTFFVQLPEDGLEEWEGFASTSSPDLRDPALRKSVYERWCQPAYWE